MFSKLGTSFVVLALIGLTLACQRAAPEVETPPPSRVKVTNVIQADVPVFVENVGQTLGSTDVEIRARVQGFLEGIHFEEGTFVSRGQILYTVDDREFVALKQTSKARLAEAKATLARLDQDVERYRPLVEQNAIPRQEFETALANRTAAGAKVDAARSDLVRAELNLEYTMIRSPIDGLIGHTEVKPGNLVGGAMSTLLATISKIDPINVRFSVNEGDYLRLAREFGSNPRREPLAIFQIVLADGLAHEHMGRVVFASRVVDSQTGTLMLEASFPNPAQIVRPGQFARVRFPITVLKDVTLVPQRSIKEFQATYSVAVVDELNRVAMRQVEVGPTHGIHRVIRSGLTPGERVVFEGLQKVSHGSTVSAEHVELEFAVEGLDPSILDAMAEH